MGNQRQDEARPYWPYWRGGHVGVVGRKLGYTEDIDMQGSQGLPLTPDVRAPFLVSRQAEGCNISKLPDGSSCSTLTPQ